LRAIMETPQKPLLKLQKYYFKMVAKLGDRYLSIFDGKTEYSLGQILHEPCEPNHGGGYYVYPTMKQAVFADIPHNKDGLYMAPRTILVCICWGDYVEYGNGKIAFSYICPTKELPLDRGYIATKTARRQIEDTKENNNAKPDGKSLLLKNVKEKLISIALPNKINGKKINKNDPIVRKKLLENKTGTSLLRDQNDVLEKEIMMMEERLQGILITK